MITSIVLIIICSLILIILSITMIFSILLYGKMSKVLLFSGAYQADEYRKAVGAKKTIKPPLPPSKTESRGREVIKTEELVDIADLDFETGYKVMEELGQ